MMLKE